MFERPVGPEIKQDKKQEKNHGHCFVVLNSTIDKGYHKNFLESPFECILNYRGDTFLSLLLSGHKDYYFTLHDKLDLQSKTTTLPSKNVLRRHYKGSNLGFHSYEPEPYFEFAQREFSLRISIELNMPLDKFHSLLKTVYSECQGKTFINNEAWNVVSKKIKASFVDVHLDVLDQRTSQWCRNDKMKPKAPSTCSIL